MYVSRVCLRREWLGKGALVGSERVFFGGYKLVRVSFVCSSENSVVLYSFVRVR